LKDLHILVAYISTPPNQEKGIHQVLATSHHLSKEVKKRERKTHRNLIIKFLQISSREQKKKQREIY
jgi:hypothetical protein